MYISYVIGNGSSGRTGNGLILNTETLDIQDIKNRFGIIGGSPLLNRAIDIARQVSPTDMSVLITGESGSGKEVFSHIIHQMSARKHGAFIAVNCGAIPEGTIDSELFGHEKGSFTGAHEARKGYFEVANGGTIFLDEVAELPLGTQARLLRILESGEYLRVGSSKVQKTDVRIIAATNVDVYNRVKSGKFREDLYYRLNTVPLRIPALHERKEDIFLLFRKFSADFSDKYRSPGIQLEPDAIQILSNYSWPGNVRQLKNIAEQICVLEKERNVTAAAILNYIPNESGSNLPMAINGNTSKEDFTERDILYKVLFDMKKDMMELKKLVAEILQNDGNTSHIMADNTHYINQLYQDVDQKVNHDPQQQQLTIKKPSQSAPVDYNYTHDAEEVEESLSLIDKESDLIKKALKKHKGKRKFAAQELGISERTLYRKIKELNL
jgi:transcriptional regulator with PAS, ATPase and Fis domain